MTQNTIEMTENAVKLQVVDNIPKDNAILFTDKIQAEFFVDNFYGSTNNTQRNKPILFIENDIIKLYTGSPKSGEDDGTDENGITIPNAKFFERNNKVTILLSVSVNDFCGAGALQRFIMQKYSLKYVNYGSLVLKTNATEKKVELVAELSDY
jgi:hypothetical protein